MTWQPEATSLTPEQILAWMERRRRARLRRQWAVVGVVVLGGLLFWGSWWAMHRHWLAASTLALEGAQVRWVLSDGAWRHGGSTHVKGTPGFWRMSDLSDSNLLNLRHLRHVETLDLRGCVEITRDGLAVLRDLPHLRSLDLSMTLPHPTYAPSKLDDGLIDHLAGLDRLEELSLVDVTITDAGLERLKPLPKLVFLDLSGTRVTDASLPALLKRLPKLDTLAVERTAVTPEAVAELGRQYPGLMILHESTNAPLEFLDAD